MHVLAQSQRSWHARIATGKPKFARSPRAAMPRCGRQPRSSEHFHTIHPPQPDVMPDRADSLAVPYARIAIYLSLSRASARIRLRNGSRRRSVGLWPAYREAHTPHGLSILIVRDHFDTCDSHIESFVCRALRLIDILLVPAHRPASMIVPRRCAPNRQRALPAQAPQQRGASAHHAPSRHHNAASGTHATRQPATPQSAQKCNRTSDEKVSAEARWNLRRMPTANSHAA